MRYTHTLTETEVACGVTLEDVKRYAGRALVRESPDGSTRVHVDGDLGPALAQSVARAVTHGADVDYAGRSGVGTTVYAVLD